jgi:hypothetical protein
MSAAPASSPCRAAARRCDLRRATVVDYVLVLVGLAAVHLLAVASPGPSTVLVLGILGLRLIFVSR